MNIDFHIFLLIGQSNMAGRGDISEVPAIDDKRILMFRSGKWIRAKEPLHQDNTELSGVGLGMSFAKELLKNEHNVTIGLIPCAIGWTSLSQWMPETILYKNMVALVKKAIKKGVLKGILWHQGENDTFNINDAEKYCFRLREFIINLRNDLKAEKVPFISGKLAGFLQNNSEFKYVEKINSHLGNLHKSVNNYGCVNVDGLSSKKDALHFNSHSLRELGVRYARMYTKLNHFVNAQ